MKTATIGLAFGLTLALAAACAESGPNSISLPNGMTTSGGDGGGGEGGGGQGGDGAGMPVDSAFDYYVANVNDMLVEECGTCHSSGGTAWLVAGPEGDAALNYASVEAYPALINPEDCSQIVLKSLGEHSGPSMSPELGAAVSTWLELEAAERSLECDPGGTGTTASCEELLADFQACMYQGHWDASGMDQLPLQTTEIGTACNGCHSTGFGAAYLSTDSPDTMQAHKNNTFFLLRLVNCNYVEKALVPAGRYISKGTEACVNDNQCHPGYVLNAENLQAVSGYVDDVLLALDNGTCDDLALIE